MFQFKKVITIPLLIAALISCTNARSIKEGEIDFSEKTIYIQPGSFRFLKKVKNAFIAKGWQIEEFEENKTRYKLQINSKSTQLFCWNEFSEIEVEMMLVDMKNKSIVFTIISKTCDTYKNLIDELNKNL